MATNMIGSLRFFAWKTNDMLGSLRFCTGSTDFLISVTKVSFENSIIEIIPGRDFQLGGIIILPIKSQWDNFAPGLN